MSQFEGIVLSKVPYQERHIISHILLRSGKKTSICFLGGQGGGKKQKSSVVELGYALSFNTIRSNNPNAHLFSSKDYKPVWSHKKIRDNYQAFYLSCFFLELIEKVTIAEGVEFSNLDDQGFYRLLSSSLYYIDESLENDSFNKNIFLNLFLAKLIFELGITPELDHCVYSGDPLERIEGIQLVFEQGGFGGLDFIEKERGIDQTDLREFLKKIWNLKMSDYQSIQSQHAIHAQVLINYLFYQNQLNRSDFKTLSLLL